MALQLSSPQIGRLRRGVNGLQHDNHVVLPEFFSEEEVTNMQRLARSVIATTVGTHGDRYYTAHANTSDVFRNPLHRLHNWRNLRNNPSLGQFLGLGRSFGSALQGVPVLPKGAYAPNSATVNQMHPNGAIEAHMDPPDSVGFIAAISLGEGGLSVVNAAGSTVEHQVKAGDLELLAAVDTAEKWDYDMPLHAVSCHYPRYSVALVQHDRARAKQLRAA